MPSDASGRSRLALAAVAALVFALPAGAQTRGGSATIGVEQDIAGFDPLIVGVYDTGQEAAAVLIFETLTRLDDSGKPAPGLAQSWEHSADFKTWTFKLRPGVKFQDGAPFNAEAVAFNYQRMLDPANHCRCLFYISNIDHVEAADEVTAVFHLKYPAPNLPAITAPATVTTTNRARSIAGKVNVRRGRGCASSPADTTRRRFSSSVVLSGKSDAVWPSGPRPRCTSSIGAAALTSAS